MIPIDNAEDLMEYLGYFKATDDNIYRKAWENQSPEFERWGVRNINLMKDFINDQDVLVFGREMKGAERMLAPVRTEMRGIVSAMNLIQGYDEHLLYINGSDNQWTVIDLVYKNNARLPTLSGLFVGTWQDALTSFLSDGTATLAAHYADFMAQRPEADLLSRSAKNSKIAVDELSAIRKRLMLQLEAVKNEHMEVFNVLHKARENKAALSIMQHPSYDGSTISSDDAFPLNYHLTNHLEPISRKDNTFEYIMRLANTRIKKTNSDELARSNFTIWRTVKDTTERYAEYDRHNGIWNLV